MRIIINATPSVSNLPKFVDLAEYGNYVTGVLAETGQTVITNVIPQATLDELKNLIRQLKTATVGGVSVNLFSKIKYFLPTLGDSISAALVPVVGGAPINNGYLTGDLATLGVQGNAVKKLEMPEVANAYGTKLGFILTLTSTPANLTVHDILNKSLTASSVFGILIRSSQVQLFGYQNSGNGFITETITNLAANYAGNVSDGNFAFYKNGAKIDENIGGGTVPATTIEFYRNNSRYGGFMLTNDMSPLEFEYTLSLYNAYIAAIGR